MPTPNDQISCDGWWHEVGYGRQSMHDLRLKFDDFRINGSGHDIVGPFTLTGGVTPDGQVTLAKTYPTHDVFYFGTYDGEGLFWGEWFLGDLRDRWLIKIKGSKTSAADDAVISEIA
jgi:hypothetical protein